MMRDSSAPGPIRHGHQASQATICILGSSDDPAQGRGEHINTLLWECVDQMWRLLLYCRISEGGDNHLTTIISIFLQCSPNFIPFYQRGPSLNFLEPWWLHCGYRQRTQTAHARQWAVLSAASHHRELGVTFKTYKKFNIHKQWDIRLWLMLTTN